MIRIRGRLMKNESGSAFILALIFLALGAIIITPILGLFSTELSALNLGTGRLKELYAADSGVEHAMWNIVYNSDLMPGYNNEPPPYTDSLSGINGKNVNYSIYFVDENLYKVISIATGASGTNTTIEAYVAVPEGGIFSYAATAMDGNMKVGGTVTSSPVTSEGDVYADGNITGTGTVDGDAEATGSISGSTEIGGTATPYAAPEKFPTISTALYLDQANEGTLITGNYSPSSTSSLGPAHITGDFKLESPMTLTLTGTVWVDGTVSVTGGAVVVGAYTIVSNSSKPDAIKIAGGTDVDLGLIPLFIATQGGVAISGGSMVSAIVYAPNGQVDINGTGTIVKGSVAGESVNISGSIIYPADLQKERKLPGGNLSEIVTWKIT